MDTKQFEENVAAYVEGLLDEATMKAMDAKRAECPECAELARLHESILAALDSTEQVKAPAGLERQILAAVEAEDMSLAKIRKKALTVSVSVAAVLLAGLVPFMVGAFKGSVSVPDTSQGLSMIIYFTAHWLAGIETIYLTAAYSDQWESIAFFLQKIAQPITIPNVQLSIPGYVIFALVISMAVIIWAVRDSFGRQQRLVISSAYRRGLI
ncbi:anti-sigma factor family protein [Gemmatimonadota bacterium]